jgi:hypothetical protein
MAALVALLTEDNDVVENQENQQLVYQSTLEFWKATFEYFKHFSAISLASIAAFAGLLAGAFDSPPVCVKNSLLGLLLPLPYVSRQLLGLVSDYRSALMIVAFFAFGMAGFFR